MRRLAAAALLVAATACGRGAAPRDYIAIGLATAPANLDPGVGVDESSQKLQQLLYSSLLKVDGALRVVPDLATRFDTIDWQTFTAEIPRGVKFHDGHEMTSADVVFTFRRFLDPAFASARKGAYRELQSIDAVDRYTIAFKLKAPSAAFPINLVMGIVPDGAKPSLSRQPVGSGPYRLTDFVPDDHVSLAPFADYYQGAPANSGLVFKVVPDETMRGLELRKGDIDLVVNDLSPDMIHTLAKEARLRVVTGPGTDYAYLGFNLRDPQLQDVRVRQAIGFALDRRAIVSYLRRGLAQPATLVVPPMSWAYEPDTLQFEHNLARARALLDEAGVRDPDGDGPRPRLSLTLKTSTDERYRVQAAVIQQQLAAVGIAIDVRSSEFATLMSDVVRGNVQLYTLQFVGVTDPDMLRRVFHSTQTPPNGFNRGYYANADVDRMIDAATAALDEGERRRYYMAAQRLISQDAPVIGLWTKTNVAVSQPGLQNITLSPIADFAFLKNVARAK